MWRNTSLEAETDPRHGIYMLLSALKTDGLCKCIRCSVSETCLPSRLRAEQCGMGKKKALLCILLQQDKDRIPDSVAIAIFSSLFQSRNLVGVCLH